MIFQVIKTTYLPNPQTYNDTALLSRIAQGDERAFKQVFDAFMQPLTNFGHQIINNNEEAKDIAIQLFERLWENRGTVPSIQSLQAYLYQSMRNGCLNYLRHKKVVDGAKKDIMPIETEEARAESLLIYAEVIQQIYTEIEALSPQLRDILLLNIVHNLNVREIAAKLDISESHVRADRSRAIGYLRLSLLKKGLLEAFLFLFALLESQPN